MFNWLFSPEPDPEPEPEPGMKLNFAGMVLDFPYSTILDVEVTGRCTWVHTTAGEWISGIDVTDDWNVEL